MNISISSEDYYTSCDGCNLMLEKKAPILKFGICVLCSKCTKELNDWLETHPNEVTLMNPPYK